MLHLLKQVVFFKETDVFLQLNGKCLVGANGIYLHLETPKLQDVFFQNKLNSHRKSMCYILLHRTMKDFLERHKCFVTSPE
jgi:hypothetical protein